MLDMYDFRNDIWLCHSFNGECFDFTAFVSDRHHYLNCSIKMNEDCKSCASRLNYPILTPMFRGPALNLINESIQTN